RRGLCLQLAKCGDGLRTGVEMVVYRPLQLARHCQHWQDTKSGRQVDPIDRAYVERIDHRNFQAVASDADWNRAGGSDELFGDQFDGVGFWGIGNQVDISNVKVAGEDLAHNAGGRKTEVNDHLTEEGIGAMLYVDGLLKLLMGDETRF